jgi:ABC-type branched-subunit amino acid transport system ATPase component
VEENLRLGAYSRRDTSGLSQDYERVHQYFPVLAQRRHQQEDTLSGGEQQMLAVARALMSRQRLLLDEPSLGLAPLVVREIFRIIRAINQEEQVSVLLVERLRKRCVSPTTTRIIQVDENLHRRLAVVAAASGASVNAWITALLDRETKRVLQEHEVNG